MVALAWSKQATAASKAREVFMSKKARKETCRFFGGETRWRIKLRKGKTGPCRKE